MTMAKESDSHKRWAKENTIVFSTRLQKSTDADILAFLEGKAKQTIVKAALREYMENHKGDTK